VGSVDAWFYSAEKHTHLYCFIHILKKSNFEFLWYLETLQCIPLPQRWTSISGKCIEYSFFFFKDISQNSSQDVRGLKKAETTKPFIHQHSEMHN